MNKFAVTLFVFGLAGVLATPFKDCGSIYTLNEVRVEGCTALPCTIHRGSSIAIEIDFVATEPATEINANAYGNIAGFWEPFPGTFPPGCESLIVGDCPLEANEVITYLTEIAIETSWPAISVTGKWEIRDENQDLKVCFQIPLKLV